MPMPALKKSTVPSEVVIEITGQCNMHCTYCTQAGKRPPHLPLKEIKDVIDQAKNLGVKAIRITGGEPLLVPYLDKILSYARQQRFYVLLNTNATVMTPKLTRIIGQTVDNILISLQGYDQTSTRALTRSSGDFNTKINNIFLLKNYAPLLRLGTVITPAFIDYVDKYISLIEKIKPAAWELFRPMTAPSARRKIAPGDYQQLALPLLKLQKKGIHATIGNAIPLCLLKNRKTARLVCAGARADDGHTRLVYDARGFFKPSYFINKNLGTNLKKAWGHPLLAELNDVSRLPQQCRSCTDLEVCCGGSRTAAAMARGNRPFADPLMPGSACA
jgi:MoaA/NifB/PqqE/SkfB family radical SAM enzyme